MRPTVTGFLIAVVAVLIAAIAILVFRNRGAPSPSTERRLDEPFDPAGLFIATESESNARAAKVLPGGPTENARHVLGEVPAPSPDAREEPEEQRDYAPDADVEWAVHIEFGDGATLTKRQIVRVITTEWLNATGQPTLFGFSPEEGRWTYLHAAGTPEVYSRLQLAWEYLGSSADGPFTAESAARWLRETERMAQRFPGAGVRPDIAPDDAARRANAYESLAEQVADSEMLIRLRAPEGRTFEGRALWDALESLGLRWGDGDLFHWVNPHLGSGDQVFFSVATSTEPGYFFPEEAVAGRIHVEDLTFSMSVHRTYSPGRILEAMVRAAKYVQRRLGGELVGALGNEPLDEDALAAELERTVRVMEAAGIPPGSHAALRMH